MYIGNSYKDLVHDGNLVNGVRACKHFIMASTIATFPVATRVSSLLTTLSFVSGIVKVISLSQSIDLYDTGFVYIRGCFAKAATKSKTSKIAWFKEYLENLPNLRPLEEKVSSSEDKEQDENHKMKLRSPWFNM